jgi:NAD(P)-dependent dehydrogenase (short-subunit alcohol dehydrogenase family)
VRSQTAMDDAVSQGITAFGKIDILIANAGIWTIQPFWELSDETWDSVVDVNLGGTWRSAKAVAPHMIERGSGSIVMVSSVNGFEPGANYAHYTASKFGVIGLMKTVALELAPYGVRCNAVCPGAVRSGMTDNQGGWDLFAGHPGGTPQDLIDGGHSFTALRGHTFMEPESIAGTAVFLNSSLAASVTGSAVVVDAGHLLLTGINPNPQR